jgi:hypothetical protein
MKTACTLFVGALVFPLILLTASSAGSEENAGIRRGAIDESLTIHGALFLIDVSRIDGADQSFTANVFLILRWRDERLASESSGHRRKGGPDQSPIAVGFPDHLRHSHRGIVLDRLISSIAPLRIQWRKWAPRAATDP